MCQEVCTFQYYNLRTKKVNCDNPVQKRVIHINIDKINFYRNIIADKLYIIINIGYYKMSAFYFYYFNVYLYF